MTLQEHYTGSALERELRNSGLKPFHYARFLGKCEDVFSNGEGMCRLTFGYIKLDNEGAPHHHVIRATGKPEELLGALQNSMYEAMIDQWCGFVDLWDYSEHDMGNLVDYMGAIIVAPLTGKVPKANQILRRRKESIAKRAKHLRQALPKEKSFELDTYLKQLSEA
jgi:hypothetical protein